MDPELDGEPYAEAEAGVDLADAESFDADVPDAEPYEDESGAGVAIEAPVTGDAAVDEAVAHLARAAGAPLEQQLPVLEAVHRTLQDRLADVEG